MIYFWLQDVAVITMGVITIGGDIVKLFNEY